MPMTIKQKASIGFGASLIVLVMMVITYLSCLAAEVPFIPCVLAMIAMIAGMAILVAGVWLIIKPFITD